MGLKNAEKCSRNGLTMQPSRWRRPALFTGGAFYSIIKVSAQTTDPDYNTQLRVRGSCSAAMQSVISFALYMADSQIQEKRNGKPRTEEFHHHPVGAARLALPLQVTEAAAATPPAISLLLTPYQPALASGAIFTQHTGTANPFDGVDVGFVGAPSFVDVDADGDMDAFIGEYGGSIRFFENTHCSFRSEAGGALVAGSLFHFGNGESWVTVKVTDVGDPPLTGITASCTPSSHPNAITGLQNGVYWTLTPTLGGERSAVVRCATPFNIDLEFPFKGPDATGKICRYTGSVWGCNQNAFTGTTIQRTGVSDLSDWTVGANLVPTAVEITGFRVKYPQMTQVCTDYAVVK